MIAGGTRWSSMPIPAGHALPPKECGAQQGDFQATGLENLITIVEQPTLGQLNFQHRECGCCASRRTQWRAALESKAGDRRHCSPPVVVDETACPTMPPADRPGRLRQQPASAKEVFAVERSSRNARVVSNGGYCSAPRDENLRPLPSNRERITPSSTAT